MEDLRVLIADDDAGMRMVLRRIVEKAEGFTLVSEAADGRQTLEYVERDKPRLVFLDVEMPLLSGVECARAIMDRDPNIIIIFATAHDAYMGEAFEVYAFDYLVKPFKVQRVLQTLSRARERLLSRGTPAQAVSSPSALPTVQGRLMLRGREGVSFVNLQDVLLVQREDRSTVLYTVGEGRYVVQDSLSEMQERLPANAFFRCHKSYIINLNRIRDITPYGRWTYVVRLEGTTRDALITHEKYEELQKRFP